MQPQAVERAKFQILLALLGACIGLGMLWRHATPPSVASAPLPTDCSNALGQVQGYHAPGQTLPLEVQVPAALLSDRRPVQIGGWRDPRVEGTTCLVGYGVTIGNDPQQLVWQYDPRAGTVTALDAPTRRASGW